MEFLTDLFKFMKARRKWWLGPMIVVLVVLGVLVIFGGGSAVSTYIYTLF